MKTSAERRAQQNYASKNKEKLKQRNLEYRKKNPKACLLRAAKNRALKRKIDFNLTEDDFYIPEFCPILNVPLVRHFGSQGGKENSPSLDRIDPAKGYVSGNVWVVSQKANAMKSDATIEQLKLFSKWINTLNE